MPVDDLYKVRKRDIPRVGTIFAEAFRTDPLWSKVFADEQNAERKIQAFFEIPVRFCARYGEVYATSESLEGAAAWIPGHVNDLSFRGMLFSGAWRPALKLGMQFNKKLMPIFTPLEEHRKAVMKGREYVYLEIIGVAPEQQGRGHGGKILGALTESCDAAGKYLFLETMTTGNVEIYSKYGFTVAQTTRIAQYDVPVWQMVRAPRKTSPE